MTRRTRSRIKLPDWAIIDIRSCLCCMGRIHERGFDEE
jgi:hypothetical protein